jgi:hypothetical protein
MRVVAFRGPGLHFKVVDVAAQGLRQLVDELCHAEGPHLYCCPFPSPCARLLQ